MKISKLFHWLYAILMLLPFAFFVPSVLYYAFNDNATMQSVEVPKTETIFVDFNQNVKNGNFNDGYTFWAGTVVPSEVSVSDNILELSPVASGDKYLQQEYRYTVDHKYLYKLDVKGQTSNAVVGVLYYGTAGDYLNLSVSSANVWTSLSGIVTMKEGTIHYARLRNAQGGTTNEYKNVQLFDLTQMFGVGNEPTIEEFDRMFPNSYYRTIETELIQVTYNTGETIQLIENTSIINYAWESIWDLPLFSWTKVTFVSVPFSYLTGIFGIGASNSLNYVFGYFVTISIVWLVFDLLLYVPMLAHNWIDKARIE